LTDIQQRRNVVLQTLNFSQPAVCPYYAWIDDEMVSPLAAHFGEEQFVGAPGTVRTFAGSYTAMTEIKARRIEEQENVFRDEYGVIYRDGSIWSVERPALPGPSLDGYTFPDLTTDEHFEHLDEWLHAQTNRFRIVQLGMMFFERAWWMRGMDNFFMDLHLEPAFCEEMLDGLMEVCLGVVDRLLADYGDRIDAVGMSEDYGTEKSLMINPEIWRRFIRPRIARIFERVRLGGKYAYIHSCGHVSEIIPDLVDIGVNILQPIQPEAMPRRHGRRWRIYHGAGETDPAGRARRERRGPARKLCQPGIVGIERHGRDHAGQERIVNMKISSAKSVSLLLTVMIVGLVHVSSLFAEEKSWKGETVVISPQGDQTLVQAFEGDKILFESVDPQLAIEWGMTNARTTIVLAGKYVVLGRGKVTHPFRRSKAFDGKLATSLLPKPQLIHPRDRSSGACPGFSWPSVAWREEREENRDKVFRASWLAGVE